MKLKKITAMFCAATSLVSLAACGSGSGGAKYDPLNEDQIKIIVSDLGYGTEHIHQIAKAFENTHPGKSVVVEDTVLSSQLISQLEAGSFIGDICMFNDDVLWKKWRNGMFVSINDVVSAKPDGEESTVGEKCDLIDAYKMTDGNYYTLPWMNSISSYVYNKTALDTLLGAGKWELPKTTDDLWAMCEEIKGKGGYGFVWNGAYFGASLTNYMTQYNGVETQRHFDKGEYYDEASATWKLSDAENVQCVSMNTGYLRAAEQIETMVKKYSHQYSKNMTFINAQATWAGLPYADDSKLCAFMPNGDWAYNETKDYFDATGHVPGFMQFPVISDIVETLELYEDGTTAYSTLSKDKKNAYNTALRAAIDYVEGATQTAPTYKGKAISENDMKKIREARMTISTGAQDSMFIPGNSKKVELAKEFLVFMASDMAVKIYSQNTNGLSPYVSDSTFESITFDTDFMNEVLALRARTNLNESLYNDLKQSGYYLPKAASFDQGFSSGTHTAKSLVEADIKFFKEQWNTMLKNAGMANK